MTQGRTKKEALATIVDRVETLVNETGVEVIDGTGGQVSFTRVMN